MRPASASISLSRPLLVSLCRLHVIVAPSLVTPIVRLRRLQSWVGLHGRILTSCWPRRALRHWMTKYYAVVKGRKPGVYDSWPDAQNQVSGFKGALHRSFPSAELATGWLREHGVNSSATSISQPPTTSLVAQPAASHSSSARPTSSSRAYSSSSSSPSSSSASRPVRLTPRHPQPASSLIYTLYCDGASRGNPGHAGCGFVLFNPNQTLFAEYKNYLGDDQTNNVAEYRGLIGGLQVAQFRGIRYLRVRADSNLICMQTTGAWEVHAEHLRPYREQAAGLLDTFDWWEVQQVPREENKIADRLSNEAIDERSDKVTTWYGDLDQALGADEEEDEDEEEKSEAATGDGTGRGTDARGPMRTKRLGPAGREREDDSVEKIILPLKRHKQTR